MYPCCRSGAGCRRRFACRVPAVFVPAWAAATVPSLCPRERRQLLPIAGLPVSLRVVGVPARGLGPRKCPTPSRLLTRERLEGPVLGTGTPHAIGGVSSRHWCIGFMSIRAVVPPPHPVPAV